MLLTFEEVKDRVEEEIKKQLPVLVTNGIRARFDITCQIAKDESNRLTDIDILQVLLSYEYLGFRTDATYELCDVQSIVRANLLPELTQHADLTSDCWIRDYKFMVESFEDEGFSLQVITAGPYYELRAPKGKLLIGKTFNTAYEAWNWLEQQGDL